MILRSHKMPGGSLFLQRTGISRLIFADQVILRKATEITGIPVSSC